MSDTSSPQHETPHSDLHSQENAGSIGTSLNAWLKRLQVLNNSRLQSARKAGLFGFFLLLSGAVGCFDMNLMAPAIKQMSFKSAENADAAAEFEADFKVEGPEEVNPPFLGEFLTVSGLNTVILEGVGLVTGLDGTGGDPPPSQYRTQLLDAMRRKNVENPNSIISSPSTALVIVRGFLPPLVQPGDRFDVEVRLPEGSTTTSLNGGWLLETSLTERAIVAGKGILEGKERARAKGPILVSMADNSSSSLLKRGRVVGGGIGLESRDMSLYVKNDMRSNRNSVRIANRIGTRFFSYDRYGHREPLAEAKTDQKLTLDIHPAYRDNFNRYIQVIQNIAFRETEVERQVRMERLEKELLIPQKAELAALQLEAIGMDAVPSLKKGLRADTIECRFYTACSLAYLGEPDGLEVLYEAARDEPAFRVFALAAMSVVEEGETHILLRQLMDNSTMELRYGAFRGMTTIDEDEPFVRGITLNDQCKLHPLQVQGDPMIHLTHHQKAEIVLFGHDQEFITPMAVTAGPHIMVNCAPGSNEVVVSRYRVNEEDQRQVVSRKIAEVLIAAAEMGASYPDLAQLLVQAERQQNLPGPIGIDKLPEAGRYYKRPSKDGKQKPSKAKIGRETLAPNQFIKTGEDKEGMKPLLTPGITEEEEKSGASDETQTAMLEEPPPQNEDEEVELLEPLSPLKRLKKIMTPKSGGAFAYPDEE